ncbi:glutathione S-transferase family protein [Bradyrhizobium sp. C-145]|jgi:glutathione S-transferase|uniref:glutathione S-transferase family protein n=1 Tax=Bradyrhizobium sp. C-145 TaxID=574727 RepID=UPI00201B8080|nr:glutathione S-transferase family protein [Bradyrhizobium sp. C-145]UQR63109.1 glutathione S-transferase family protein [Bradyrhizobium sp. C-145]
MKLYYAPNTSAVGIRILLEEIGKPYEIVSVDLRAGEQYQPPFASINPKSKVPTLVRDDNSVLTEFGAIARWLSRTNPEAALLPADPEPEARATELLDYVVGTVHMRGFSRMIVPMVYGPAAQREDIVAAGRRIVTRGFEIIDAGLSGKSYVADRYSYADAALFYVERWAEQFSMPMPANCKRHYEAMKKRAAVARVLAADRAE